MMQTNSFVKYERGSALIVAVFIIVIMTLLGTALVRMTNSSAETIAYEVLGARAYNAAQSGLQKKLVDIFPLEPAIGVCSGPELYDFSTIKGLESCKAINVDCIDSEISGVNYYTITSTGRCEVGGVLTTRKIEVKARKL
jgi:MSHA biogenesis protein MshP